MASPFGKYVKRLRGVRKLTQDQLAQRANLSADTIRRLENGEFSPSLQTLRKLCSGLGISITTLFVGFEGAAETPELITLKGLLENCDRTTLRFLTRVVVELLDILETRQ